MTKDADKMICCIYKCYLDRIKSGSSKTSARNFDSDYQQSDKFLSKWHVDDFATVRNELHRLSFLKVNIIGGFSLTDNGISYMENRFKNNLIELTSYIAQFIP